MTEKRKIAIGVGIVGAIAGAAILLSKRAPPPPDTDKATLWGIVTDASMGKAIKDIAVACGGYFASTDGNGRYEMPNITPGVYAVTFTDPLGRYEPLTV